MGGVTQAVTATTDRTSTFERFFEGEYERLARALFLLTSDPAEAEDLAQEAMVRVYERWDRVSTMTDPVGYLFRTAMNLSRSRRRRIVAATRRTLVPRPSRTPADVVETRDELERSLASLPAGQRRAIVLVEWVGLTDEEAGAILGIRPVSVRVRVSRARSVLQRGRERNDD